MKLEDCKVGLKVRLKEGVIVGTGTLVKDEYPDLKGEIHKIEADAVAPIWIMPDGWWFRLDQIEPYIEPGETEYRQLKDITPRAIFAKSDRTLCFMQEYTRFVAIFNVAYEEVIPFEDLVDELEDEGEGEVVWTAWLIQHGFIEKVVEEVTYSLGDKFLNKEIQDKYILAKTGEGGTVALINLVSGNTWAGNIQVKDSSEITKTELGQLTGSWDFVKIEDK